MKISSSEMITIIQEVTEDPPHKPATKLKLSDEALALLSGPGGSDAFFAKYGEYFVYGSMNRSNFLAACQFKADKKETLDTFKASMNIGAKDIAEAGLTLETGLKAVHGKVSTKIHCKVFGYGGTGEPVFTTTEIKSPYEKFQKNFKPSPYMALLQHYSTLDGRIPLPGREVASKSVELTEAYQRIFVLQGRVVSLSMKRAENVASAINKSYESLEKISIDDKNWKDKLTTWSNGVTTHQNEYQKWVLRSTLIEDAKKLNEPQLRTGVLFASGPQNQWARGIMLDFNHTIYGKIAEDVEKKEDAHWAVEYAMLQSQTRKYTVSRHDRIIIGFVVQSHRADDSNG
ncbi:hypothetical protein PVAG01_07909 [Phlyctema vagabunda]|uniref:Uncharacterized protein n=1 Tax=Phlyctema vagabunda TaxID=108571 RepID=A0ABR4PDS0_9HELO